MHGGGHARDKGVTHLNLGNVPESQTDSSGFPTFARPGGEGLVGVTGSWLDGVSGLFLCRLAGKMGSFGKRVDWRRVWGEQVCGTGFPSVLSHSMGRGCSPKSGRGNWWRGRSYITGGAVTELGIADTVPGFPLPTEDTANRPICLDTRCPDRRRRCNCPGSRGAYTPSGR